jgi:AmiR/NasT family two-component response regulator
VRTSKSRDVIMNLEKALATNREIGIAVRIIMSTHKLTAERSFELLRLVSMNSNRKVIDVAARIVLTGTLELDRPLPT